MKTDRKIKSFLSTSVIFCNILNDHFLFDEKLQFGLGIFTMTCHLLLRIGTGVKTTNEVLDETLENVL